MKMETTDASYITPPATATDPPSNSTVSAAGMPAHAQADGKKPNPKPRLAKDQGPSGSEAGSLPKSQIAHGARDSDVGDASANDKARTKSKEDEENAEKHNKKPAGQKRLYRDLEDTFSDDENHHMRLTSLVAEAVGEPLLSSGTLSQRRAKAARRLLQTKAYAELVEDRILELEQKVGKLSKNKSLLAEPETTHGDLPLLLKYVPMGWNEYSSRANFEVSRNDRPGRWQHRPEVDEMSKPIIEILTEEPRSGVYVADPRNRSSDVTKSQAAGHSSPSSKDTPSHAEPYRIRIRSKLLLKLLKYITDCNVLLGPHEHRLQMIRPFKLLVRFADRIQRYANDLDEELRNVSIAPALELRSQDALGHLKVLTDMMKKYLSRPLNLQRCINHTVTKVSFSQLWYFFKPGQAVRTPAESRIQVYRIAKVTGGRDLAQTRDASDDDSNHASKKFKDEGYSEGSFIIECFYIHYDGNRFGPVNASFQIRKFDGERDIRSLPVAPLQCYQNETEIRKSLVERGQKFVELSDPKKRAHRKYHGLTLDKNPEQVESEVIIDFELAFIQTKIGKPSLGLQDRLISDDTREVKDYRKTMHPMCDRPGCCGNDVTFSDYEVDEIERNEFRDNHRYLFDANIEDGSKLKDDYVILLPPHVYGFVLRTRRWATFGIDRLEAIPPNYEGWDKLVLEDDIKKTVLALVRNHERQLGPGSTKHGAPSSIDLVQGKGRGLIILLHGEPGVGKTSTAECVAALTGRPLFPVTCGDIGDKAETVEMNLEKNFQLAHKWGCVLLLDEADIFLSARSESDIQRNAIVSVFLRTLEYYSGILFLTTNRVGKMDRAFKSRIHFSLLYKRLNWSRTKQIWQNNMDRVEEDLCITCERAAIINFAKEHYSKLKRSPELIVWNGRQIRNAFQTSIAIAAHKVQLAHEKGGGTREARVILDASHFDQVARSARQFDRYLKKASDHNDAEEAKELRERDDKYDSPDERDDEKTRARKRAKGGGGGRKGKKRKSKPKRRESVTDDSDSDSRSDSDSHSDTESNLDSDLGSDADVKTSKDSESEGSSEDEKARRPPKKRKRKGE